MIHVKMIRSLVLASLLLGGCSTVPDKPEPVSKEQEAGKLFDGTLNADILGVAEIKSAEAAELQGEQALSAGDVDRAAALLVRSLQLEPTRISASLTLARLYRRQNNSAFAVRAYQYTLGQQSENVEALEGLGMTALEQRQYPLSQSLLEKSLKLWRESLESGKTASGSLSPYIPVDAMVSLGVLLDMQKQFDQAEISYKEALQHRPRDPEILNNLGYSRYLAGKWDEAGQWYQQALAYDVNNPRTVRNLALLRVRQENYQEAVYLLEQIVSPWEARNDAGYLAMLAGDYDQAGQLLHEATEAAPFYYEQAFANLSRLRQLRTR
ncbi:MAG: tetratricopeptide repeat protein [Endozoicomonas sp.]